MTDLTGLSAEELAEKVLLGTSVGTYDRITPIGREALSELVRRASERDQAVRERNEAIEAFQREAKSWAAAMDHRDQAAQRADRLAAALEQIAAWHDCCDTPEARRAGFATAIRIARSALAADCPEDFAWIGECIRVVRTKASTAHWAGLDPIGPLNVAEPHG